MLLIAMLLACAPEYTSDPTDDTAFVDDPALEEEAPPYQLSIQVSFPAPESTPGIVLGIRAEEEGLEDTAAPWFEDDPSEYVDGR